MVVRLKSDMGLIFAVILSGLLCVGALQVFLLCIGSMVLFGVSFSLIIICATSFFLLTISAFIITIALGEKGYYRVTERRVYKYPDIQRQKQLEQLGQPYPLPPQYPPPHPHYTARYGYDPYGTHTPYNPYDYTGRYGRQMATGPYRTIRFYSFMKYTLDIPKMRTLLAVFLLSLVVGFVVLTVGGPLLFLFPICFIIAFSFPSLMWISYVYHQGQRAPEPRDSIFKALLWGMFSTVPAVIINTSFGYALGAGLAVLVPILVAPFNEEFFKPLGLKFLTVDIKNRIDGLVFGVTCGMGFAMTENLLYELSFLVTEDVAKIWTLNAFLRGVGSTIIHAVGSGLIGFMFASYYLKKRMARAGDASARREPIPESEAEAPEQDELKQYRPQTEDEFAIATCTLRKLVLVYLVAVGIHSGWNILATLAGMVSVGLAVLVVATLFIYAGLMFLLLKYLIELSGGTMRFQC